MCPVYLPPEIWMRVIGSLCYHCHRNGSHPAVPDYRLDVIGAATAAPTGTLASLCRVSKVLNHLATPLLYHLPITSKPALLLRTLTSCPELSLHVREFHHNVWTNWPMESLDEYPPAFLAPFERKKEYAREHISADTDSYGWVEAELCEIPLEPHVQDAAVMTLLPNLTSISIDSYYRYICFGFSPGSLSQLTSVCISHGDTEGFLHPNLLKYLTEAAPNITSLYLRTCGTEEVGEAAFPVFPQVTTLMMETSAINAASWPFFLRAFPRLETLAYGGSDPSEYSQGGHARDIQLALIEHCTGLKKLCVDFTYTECFDDSEQTERAFGRGLASLQKLEYLITDSSCIGKPELEDGEENGNVSGIRLDALPASLRGLHISSWRTQDEKGLGKALLHLAGELHDRLPALEKVSIVTRKEFSLKDDLKSAWENAGVELTFTLGDEYSYSPMSDWMWP